MSLTATTLAQRLGKTVHESPLRYKLERIRSRFPFASALCLEDWLVAVANARGARVVTSAAANAVPFESPPATELSNAELTVGICQLQNLDRPQMLRLAAQLISRNALEVEQLLRLAQLERVQPTLAELARQALRVAPEHATWLRIRAAFGGTAPLRAPLLHWTRLAEPQMQDHRGAASGWVLIS